MVPVNNAEKNLFRNMLRLVTGEGLARFVGILAAPFIARIYTSSDIGVLSVFVSLVALMEPFATLRYSLAIPLHKNSIVSVNIVALSFLVLIVLSLVLVFVFSFFAVDVLDIFSMQVIADYWYLIPVTFFFLGIYEVLSQLIIRKKAFSIYAKTSVYQRIVGAGLKIGLGLLGLKPLGLLIGNLMTSVSGVGVLFNTFWKDIRHYKKYISARKIIYVCKRYIKFPMFRVPSQMLLVVAGNIPILYFAWKFDASATGQIAWARTMLSIPITFITYAVGKAFFAEIAQLGKDNAGLIYQLTVKTVKKLFIISLLPLILIVVLGPWLFQIVFGSEWYIAGVYARYMSVFLFLQFMYAPIGEGIFNVFEKQSYVLFIEVFRVCIVGLAFGYAYFMHLSPLATILVYSLGLAIQYVLSIFIAFRIVRPTTS